MGSWQISTRNIRRIRTWEEAKKVWEETKPWLNEPYKRPIAERRAKHKAIQINGESFACQLYGTALVTYHKDFVELRSYDTCSSRIFANCVCPRGTNTVGHKGQMFWKILTVDGWRFYRPASGPFKIYPIGTGQWHIPDPPEPEKERVFDRKKGAAARKVVKPYAKWFEFTWRLAGETFRHNPYRTHVANKLETSPDDPKVFATLFRAGITPDDVIEQMYSLFGARHKVQTPSFRLPRN